MGIFVTANNRKVRQNTGCAGGVEIDEKPGKQV